jgi:hypothetical protein
MKKRNISFMQAIFRGAYTTTKMILRGTAAEREYKRETFQCASKVLEVIALDVFAKNGWQSNGRLCL